MTVDRERWALILGASSGMGEATAVALAHIAAGTSTIRIGAGGRQAGLLAWPELLERQPLLAAALPWVGHAQTRSRGTVCGSSLSE